MIIGMLVQGSLNLPLTIPCRNSLSQRVFLVFLALSILPAVSLPAANLRVAELTRRRSHVDVMGIPMQSAMTARSCEMCMDQATGCGGEEMRGSWRCYNLRLRGAGDEKKKSPPPFFFGGKGRLNSKQDLAQRLPSISAFNRTSDEVSATQRESAQPEIKKKKHTKSFPVRHRLWASFTDVFTALAALEQAPGSLMKSNTEQKAAFMRSLWQGFLPVMAYACSSIYMVISQAYVLRHNKARGVNYATLLLMYQNICGIMLYFPAVYLGWQTFAFFDTKAAYIMLPNSALFAIMVYSSTQAIRTLAVPMMSMLRNLAPITITLVEWLLMKGPAPSNGVLFSMFLLIFGAYVAALNDLAFSPEGYLWMLTNVVSNVSHLLVLRKLKLNKYIAVVRILHIQSFCRDLSNTQILHYSALWSLFWLIPVGLYEDIGKACRDLYHMPLTFKLVVASTGINSVFMFLATIWCLVGALNKIPIAIMGFMFFNSPTTKLGLVGISFGLLGGIIFTIAKLQEMSRAISRSQARIEQKA